MGIVWGGQQSLEGLHCLWVIISTHPQIINERGYILSQLVVG